MQDAQHQADDAIVSTGNDEVVSSATDADRRKRLISLLAQLGEERDDLRKRSERLDDVQMRFFKEFVFGGAEMVSPDGLTTAARGEGWPSKTLSTSGSRQRVMMNSPIGSAILLISIFEIVQQFLGYDISRVVINVVAAAGVIISLLLFAVLAMRSRVAPYAKE